MEQAGRIANAVSYAHCAKTKTAQAFIRTMENATGRRYLMKRVQGYRHDITPECDFWQVIMARCGLSLEIIDGLPDNIPQSGPLIVVSNHPFGILDGLVMGYLLSRMRGDFRIMAHNVFDRAPELRDIILPVSFDGTKEAADLNIRTRRTALDFLTNGGAIGIFPGGTVATARKLLSKPADPVWRTFTAKMVLKSGATVVPVFFYGHNSRLFQIASHLSYTLRMGLMLREFRASLDAPVKISIGQPVPPAVLRRHRDNPRQLMEFLRQTTYALNPAWQQAITHGYEFEKTWRGVG